MSVKLCLVFVVVLLAIDESYCHQKYTIFDKDFENLQDVIEKTKYYAKMFEHVDLKAMTNKIKHLTDDTKECTECVDRYVRKTRPTDSMVKKAKFEPIDNCKQYLQTHDTTNPGDIGLKCLRICELMLKLQDLIYTVTDLYN